jgi:hypothetical protein
MLLHTQSKLLAVCTVDKDVNLGGRICNEGASLPGGLAINTQIWKRRRRRRRR